MHCDQGQPTSGSHPSAGGLAAAFAAAVNIQPQTTTSQFAGLSDAFSAGINLHGARAPASGAASQPVQPPAASAPPKAAAQHPESNSASHLGSDRPDYSAAQPSGVPTSDPFSAPAQQEPSPQHKAAPFVFGRAEPPPAPAAPPGAGGPHWAPADGPAFTCFSGRSTAAASASSMPAAAPVPAAPAPCFGAQSNTAQPSEPMKPNGHGVPLQPAQPPPPAHRQPAFVFGQAASSKETVSPAKHSPKHAKHRHASSRHTPDWGTIPAFNPPAQPCPGPGQSAPRPQAASSPSSGTSSASSSSTAAVNASADHAQQSARTSPASFVFSASTGQAPAKKPRTPPARRPAAPPHTSAAAKSSSSTGPTDKSAASSGQRTSADAPLPQHSHSAPKPHVRAFRSSAADNTQPGSRQESRTSTVVPPKPTTANSQFPSGKPSSMSAAAPATAWPPAAAAASASGAGHASASNHARPGRTEPVRQSDSQPGTRRKREEKPATWTSRAQV